MHHQPNELEGLISENHLAKALITCHARMFRRQDEHASYSIAWAANLDDATLLATCRALSGSSLGRLFELTADELLNHLIDAFEYGLDQLTCERDILSTLISTLGVYGAIHRLQCLTELPSAPKPPHISHCAQRAKRYAMSIHQELTQRLNASSSLTDLLAKLGKGVKSLGREGGLTVDAAFAEAEE